MAPFARAELEQIGRKMACNEYFGASLDCHVALHAPRNDGVGALHAPRNDGVDALHTLLAMTGVGLNSNFLDT